MNRAASLSSVLMMGRYEVRARPWVSIISQTHVVLLDVALLTLLGWYLVPGELTEDEFWTRYFFRVHQIDQEEERRKVVLAGECCLRRLSSRSLTHDDLIAGPTDQDDDFSWEDDDEDAAPKVEASPIPTAPVLNRDKLSGVTDAPGTMSPQRSDDSFDIVSSGRTSTTGDASAAHVDEDGTSDGDDDDDDDDDEEDDEEEESDWE
jgi:hypothetical protein